MKTSELNKVMKELALPAKYTKAGKLAYYRLNHETGASILVGIYLDSSIDANLFFVQYFVQCLYIPFTTYVFSLGDRIGKHWKVTDIPEINQKLYDFNKLNKLNTFSDFLPYLEQNPYYGESTGRNQCFALTYFIQKNYAKSLQFLNDIIVLKNHVNSEWFKQDIKNAEQIKSLIDDDKYQTGIEQILKWQSETMTAIKLR